MVALPGSLARTSDSRSELPSQLRAYLVGMLVIVAAGAVLGGLADLLLGAPGQVGLASLGGRVIVVTLLGVGVWVVGLFPNSARLHRGVDAAAPLVLSMAPVLEMLRAAACPDGDAQSCGQSEKCSFDAADA